MSESEMIIRAWKDPEFRSTLNPEQIAALPSHPAGDSSSAISFMDSTKFFGCTQAFSASTDYWGWGCEDEELFLRYWLAGIQVERVAGRFHSLPHERSKASRNSQVRYSTILKREVISVATNDMTEPRIFRRADVIDAVLGYAGMRVYETDGLSHLSYAVKYSGNLKRLLPATALSNRRELVTVNM